MDVSNKLLTSTGEIYFQQLDSGCIEIVHVQFSGIPVTIHVCDGHRKIVFDTLKDWLNKTDVRHGHPPTRNG